MEMSHCNRLRVALLLMLCSSLSVADITAGGKGMLFGMDHAFNVTAADGWVLDNESGRAQGLHMLFYPSGQSFADSPVIVYGRSTPRGEEKRGVAELVRDTVADFHANGSEQYRAQPAEPVTIKRGKSAALFHYQGDQWGNYEAGAYFVEENTINFLVYHARNKVQFTRHYGEFVQMVRSYRNAFLDIKPSSVEDFAQLRMLSLQDIASKEGQAYEQAAIKAAGKRFANVAGGCAGFFRPDDEKDFQVIFRISALGEVVEAYTHPANAMASCFVGLLGSFKYPVHHFDDFLLHLDMKFQ